MVLVATFLLSSAANFALALLLARFLGPSGFGTYAAVVAAAAALTVPLVDWLHLAATRFYSEETRRTAPQVRASLDAAAAAGIAAVALFAVGGATLGAFTEDRYPLLFGLAIVYTGIGATYDYFTALARARFLEGLYGCLVAVKHVTVLVAMISAAMLTEDPALVLMAGSVAFVVSGAVARKVLEDPGVTLRGADVAQIRQYAGYGLPLVAAGGFALLQAFYNRTYVAAHFGLAEAGQFALAYDVGVRIIAVLGSAADVVLFQLAVRAHDQSGAEHGRRQLRLNMGVTSAILIAAGAGLWIVLPDFEALLVPPAYQGAFSRYMTVLLPGLVLWGLTTFVVAPSFQIARTTLPITIPAILSLGVNAAIDPVVSETYGPIGCAISYTAGMAAAFIVFAVIAARRTGIWPEMRDVLGTLAAVGAMLAATLPLRGVLSPLPSLVVLIAIGGAAFLAAAFVFDLGGLRGRWARRRHPADLARSATP